MLSGNFYDYFMTNFNDGSGLLMEFDILMIAGLVFSSYDTLFWYHFRFHWDRAMMIFRAISNFHRSPQRAS